VDAYKEIQKRFTKQMLIDPNIIKHIVFDFDGVIAETDTARFEVLSNILEQFGIDFKNEYKLLDLLGTPTDIFLKQNFKFLSNEDIESIVKRRRQNYLNNLEEYCRAYPGAINTIGDLRTKGYKIHLATTNDMLVVEKLLSHLKLFNSFDSIFYREKIVNSHTHKKDYKLFLTESCIDPAMVVVVEDSMIGVKAAKDANLSCIAFDRFDNLALKKYADLTLRSYVEFRALFGLNRSSSQQER
jgi:beta-phosphoglucomutase